LFQGKQHGSLARAGKVKSQTPKVEKQEKKKKPKGRAYKRLLYNRRFVTVANLRPGAKRRVLTRSPTHFLILFLPLLSFDPPRTFDLPAFRGFGTAAD
jgi:small subunit ribosomal protein S30e